MHAAYCAHHAALVPHRKRYSWTLIQRREKFLPNKQEQKKAASAATALDEAHTVILASDGSIDEGLDILNTHLSDLVAIKQAAASGGN